MSSMQENKVWVETIWEGEESANWYAKNLKNYGDAKI